MSSLNKVQIIGNLGKTPEAKYIPSGKKVVTVSVGVGSSWKDSGGEKHTETEWFNVELWGGSADFVQEYAGKGDSVYVEGRLKTERYEDKDGTAKFFTKIVASNFQLLNSKGKSDTTSPKQNEAVVAPNEDEFPF